MYSFNVSYQIKNLSENRMVILSEDESYYIQDSAYAQILNLFKNDRLSKKSILSKTSQQLEKTKCEFVLDDLIKKGIILDNTIKSDKLTQKTLSILSYSDLPVEPIHQTFSSLGITVGEQGDFYVLIVNDYLDNRLKKFCEEARYLNRPWCLIKPKGKCIWIGPIFNGAKEHPHVNWNLVATRIKENSHAKVDVLGFESESLALQNPPHLPTNAAVAYNIAATEIAKWLLTEKSLLTDTILTYNSASLDTSLHQISSSLSSLQQKKPVFSNIPSLKESKKCFFDDLGERASSPEATYEKIKQFNSPITGFIAKSYYRNESNFHIFYGPRSLACSDKQKPITSPRPPEIVVGKHKNKTLAEIGFIAEALERYFSSDLNLHPKHYAPYYKICDIAIHPYELLNYSPSQYIHRKELNAKSTPFQWIPTSFDDSIPISWLFLKALNSQIERYIPASYCYMNYLPNTELQMCPGDSNGCASGNTVEEALFYAILEVVERDAMAIWWYNRLKRPSVNLLTFQSSLINDAIKQLNKLDRVFRVIDITTDIKIPTFVAVSWKKDGSQIILGSGAHLNPLIGIHRAIAEHNQILTRTHDLSTKISKVLANEKGLMYWLINEKVQSHAFIFEEKNGCKAVDFYENKASDDFYIDIQTCLCRFNQTGLDVFWVPLTPPDFPLKVVKAIIPGMRMFWRRLGKGRLYDVPVLLNDFSKPLKENELNPIAYFV